MSLTMRNISDRSPTSLPRKTVVLVQTRYPLSRASWMAETAFLNTPSRATDSSCFSSMPSMCTTQHRYLDGSTLSSTRCNSRPLVQQ